MFLATWWQGWPQYLYHGDNTYITAGIGALAVFGIFAAWRLDWDMVSYLIEALPRYGLFGTVVGLALVAYASGGDFDSILKGMQTAFNTTIAGLIGAEWLRITKFVYDADHPNPYF